MVNTKKKLLIYIGNLDIGGAQNMVFELAKNINTYQTEFLVQNRKLNNSLEEKIEKRFKVTYLGINGHINIEKYKFIMRTIDSINPDVIHSHLGTIYLSYLWCKKHKKKCAVTAHTRADVAFSKMNNFFLKRGLKNGTISLVAVSKENQKICNDFFKISNTYFVNNGVDLNRFYRKEHDKFTFINVARQDDNKNQQMIIRCFAKLVNAYTNIKLLLVGDGPNHKKLISLVNELGISEFVELTGNIGNTEDYYAISDCFLLSSHREALPMSCAEALASGIPIISTDVGGVRDIVNEKNGILVPDGDQEKFLLSMKKIIEEKPKMINECELTALNFSSKKMGLEYEYIYSRL